MSFLIQILQLATIAVGTSLLGTWLVRLLMRKLGIMDVPAGERKTHGRPVAYEGGLAIWLGILAGLGAAIYIVPELFLEIKTYYGILIGGTLVVALGVADDILDLRPIVKLAGQIAVGALMYYYEFRIEKISNPFGDELVFYSGLSFAGTCLWYGLLINGINMIDGMDGLAAGIVGISAITLGLIAFDLNVDFAVVLCAILFGACMGFLPFNFSPATIFMGDAGSMLLGFMLASITLLSSSKAPALLALIIPMLAVAVPLFETCFAFVRRLLQGQHPFRADRRHLHHRFQALGFSEKRTVLTFYYLTAYFGITAYVIQRLEARTTLPLVAVVGIGLLVVIENMRFLEKQRIKETTGAFRLIPVSGGTVPVLEKGTAKADSAAARRKRKRKRKKR